MPRTWSYQDEDERRKWQNPEALLNEIGLRRGFTFVDIGCGQGFFSLPAARIVGSRGKIFAVDSNVEAVTVLAQKANNDGLANVVTTVNEAENYLPCRNCADIVFFGIVLHDFRDPSLVLINARRMLKPGGRLVNLDWKKSAMEMGPPLEKRFDEAKASGLITAAGFTVDSIKDSGDYHYIVIARPAVL